MIDKRVLLLGAETELGAEIAHALAEAGHTLALVSSAPDADAAFRVQRLAARFGAVNQAIDATNEMAVRVMVRQVGKGLGGLNATVVCSDAATDVALAERHARREMERSGGGIFVVAGTADDAVRAIAGAPPTR